MGREAELPQRRWSQEYGNVHIALSTAAEGLIPESEAWSRISAFRVFVARGARPGQWIAPMLDVLTTFEDTVSVSQRAWVHNFIGRAHFGQREIPSMNVHMRRAADLYREAEDWERMVSCLSGLSVGIILTEDSAAIETELLDLLNGSLKIPPDARVHARRAIGWISFYEGRPDSAEREFEAGLAEAGLLTKPPIDTVASLNVGLATSMIQRDFDAGLRKFGTAIKLCQDTSGPEQVANAHYLCALACLEHDETARGCKHVAQALQIYHSSGVTLGQAPLLVAGIALCQIGHQDLAFDAWNRSADLRSQQGLRMVPVFRPPYQRASQAAGFMPDVAPGPFVQSEFVRASCEALNSSILK